jgi:hypothetical protein
LTLLAPRIKIPLIISKGVGFYSMGFYSGIST